MLKMALFDCVINEKCCSVFFVPTLAGNLTAQESPPPRICHPRQKKMLMPGGQPGAGAGGAGRRWN